MNKHIFYHLLWLAGSADMPPEAGNMMKSFMDLMREAMQGKKPPVPEKSP